MEIADFWISVKDALPKEHEMVILDGGCGFWDGICWRTIQDPDFQYRKIEWEVTHWMPYPKLKSK